jgi:Immunity protein 8
VDNEVRAVVKRVRVLGESRSPDLSPSSFDPGDSAHFGVWIQALIGDGTSDRYDSFDIFVCSPSWFSEQSASRPGGAFVDVSRLDIPESIIPGAGLWFIAHWDPQIVEQAIEKVCQHASPGPDWGTVAARIGRLIPWEYDYRYDEHLNRHFGERFPPVD